MWSIAAAAIAERPKRELIFVAAARSLQSFYMHPALCRLALFPNVRIVPVVAEAQGVTSAIRCGRPTDYLPKLSQHDVVYAVRRAGHDGQRGAHGGCGRRRLLHRSVRAERTGRNHGGSLSPGGSRRTESPTGRMRGRAVQGEYPMTRITFVHSGNRIQNIDADDDTSVMQEALRHGVRGIVAECGGNAICATCHVYVDERWLTKLEPVGEGEDLTLDEATARRLPNSRLCCQIRITPRLDGLTLRLPDRQT